MQIVGPSLETELFGSERSEIDPWIKAAAERRSNGNDC